MNAVTDDFRIGLCAAKLEPAVDHQEGGAVDRRPREKPGI